MCSTDDLGTALMVEATGNTAATCALGKMQNADICSAPIVGFLANVGATVADLTPANYPGVDLENDTMGDVCCETCAPPGKKKKFQTYRRILKN